MVIAKEIHETIDVQSQRVNINMTSGQKVLIPQKKVSASL